MITRKAIAASTYYSADFNILNKQLAYSFLAPPGPGSFPLHRNAKPPVHGVIVPFGRYDDVGCIAAWAYKDIGEHAFPELFIILSNSTIGGPHQFSTTLFADWETPLFTAKIAKEQGKKLLNSFPELRNETSMHDTEPAIETQLPLLQCVNKDHLHDITILPLIINTSSYEACTSFGTALGDFSEHISSTIICSHNLTGTPLDTHLLDAIKRIDPHSFFTHAHQASHYPFGAALVFLHAMKQRFANKTLLHHYSAGYAALTFT